MRHVPVWIAILLVSRVSRAAPTRPPDDCQRAVHVLNRLGFGPAPGDVERVLELGIGAYVDQQLHPDSIQDPVVKARLGAVPTTMMTDTELIETFDRPLRNARKVAEREVAQGEIASEDAQALVDGMVPRAMRPERVLNELADARVLRAVYSERQLNELMVDFWMNHFNVFGGKDTDRIYLTTFERDVIRPHLWGCFRDLLLATAKSPAMLYYLDNWQSIAEGDHRPGAHPNPDSTGGKPRSGINENYARELLELHTLGVDGGYTQLDVMDLARVLTGWSIAPPEEGGGFVFRDRLHDVCAKTVLGRSVPAGGGLAEGEELIDFLARHPSTARHLAFKLCQRFISDDPPSELVGRVARVFRRTNGDLRETVRAVVTSREFFDPRFFRAKVKSPFEFAVSAIRATGASLESGEPVAGQIGLLGEPLYLCSPPTGYPETSAAWISTGSLLARLNFGIALAGNKISGARVDFGRALSPKARFDPRAALNSLETLLIGDVSESTRRALEECVLQADERPEGPDSSQKIPLIAGILLGSPEFQKR